MITRKSFCELIKCLEFIEINPKIYEKKYKLLDCVIRVDFVNEKIEYPEEKGMKITHHTTCNFSDPENFVVFECIDRLLTKGYRPEHLELEKEWTLGHDAKGGRADICVYAEDGKMLLIIECKTFDKEYEKELKNTLNDGGQIFSYWQQERSCQYIALYASDFINGKIEYQTESIECKDDNNIASLAKKDSSIHLYANAHTVEELYSVWVETYEKRLCGDVIFRDDSIAYKIGVKPLRKKDLKDFSESTKIVNKFEEILRHNNVSDKENAFNRLVALFICKLVDEIQKHDNDVVDFQYKIGTDTYESLQDRLQRLHKEGMEKFMKEEIFYVSDDYAEKLVQQYTGQTRQRMIAELKQTIRILKFYTNNDFAFKDVHNEELFLQNGKILVEVVQLFEKFRIIGSADLQMLGDLFEQLLNKGFKQNEGQFFTPVPITRFIWDSLPLQKILQKDNELIFPKIIDYACGAGHFLTEGVEAVHDNMLMINPRANKDRNWVEKKIYGIEKDYRLARVSKISLFMHGAGDGNIIFGDGLENYPDKNVEANTFDILVANPPYSVSAFKPHLSLKHNQLKILDKISNNGSEIETLFVERIAQLLKPLGVAAVILPSSILTKEMDSFIGARESLLKNFFIRAIVQFGNKTFGATGTNTVVLFLQKFDEPPKRIDMVSDSVDAIFKNETISTWEDNSIFEGYLEKIGVEKELYRDFVLMTKNYDEWNDDYFVKYKNAFLQSSEVATKKKQKTFSKLSAEEQMKWYNKVFYSYVNTIEAEKIRYFGLVYKQKTLVVTAPDANKGQEEFLGYKWSNRKGQEGIQIISLGGVLYKPDNRVANDVVASLVRNSFADKQLDNNNLIDNYYYLRTQDMLDFSGVSFNKAIKTTKMRVLKPNKELTTYYLSDENVFDVMIGDRVLSTDIVEDGKIPVYSANVHEEFGRINKQNITDFSRPSVIWGIDGDWMVDYVPKNKPFYPTDHCGVIRIKNDNILPKYLVYALQVEGEYERFSRSNRASTQRVASLVIQVPELDVQKKIVAEMEAIDAKISAEDNKLKKFDEDVKSKFVEMFGDVAEFSKRWNTVCLEQVIQSIESGWSGNGIQRDKLEGEIAVLKVSSVTKGFFIPSECKVLEDPQNIKKYVYPHKDDLLFSRANTKEMVGATAIISKDFPELILSDKLWRIRFNKSTNVRFVKSVLSSRSVRNKLSSEATGTSGSMYNISMQKLKKLLIPLPPVELQNAFATFVSEIDKLRFEAEEKKKELLAEKEALFDKYFR